MELVEQSVYLVGIILISVFSCLLFSHITTMVFLRHSEAHVGESLAPNCWFPHNLV